MSRAIVAARLARWLGPWSRARPRVRRVGRVVDGPRGPFDAFLYEPERPVGSLLVLPGLYHLGPADPRADRFNAVLAACGIRVLSPLLPDFRRLRFAPELVGDARAALDALAALGDAPGLFGISFGAFPALSLLADARAPARRGVLFGAYADLGGALRFALRGDEGRPADPLNRPAVFLNLLDEMALGGLREPFEGVLDRYIRRCWGRAHMKHPAYHGPVARRLAEDLDPPLRALFDEATGLDAAARERGDARVEAALEGSARLAAFDLEPLARRVRRPVTVAHGREDDVIPFEHAARLAAALPHAEVHVTGLYDHTGPRRPATLVAEARALVGVVAGIAAAACRIER